MNSDKRIIIAAIILAAGGTAASIITRIQYNHVKVELAAAQEKALVPKIAEAANTVPAAPAGVDSANETNAQDTIMADQSSIIEDLQAKLTAQSAELSALRFNAANSVTPDMTRSNIPPLDRNNWLSNLQTNDPERYKEIIDQREKARQAAKYDIAKKAAHFLNRENADMTEDEAKQYETMMGLLNDSLNLSEKLNADLPQDQRREIGHSLRDNLRELSPLLETERDKELYRIGKELGYNDKDAEGFAVYIHDIIDVTSVNTIFRNSAQAMGWGRGGGGFGGGDNRGPGQNQGQGQNQSQGPGQGR